MDEIQTSKNRNIKYKQWKYKNDNYIVVINLERNNETFVINLLDEFEAKKEFGLGSIEKNGSNITFNLNPIDVIMIKYSKNNNNNNNNNKNNSFIVVSIVISLIIIIIVAVFIVKKYVKNKNETNKFINSTSKLINDNE